MTEQEQKLIKSLLDIIQEQTEFMLSLSRQVKDATEKVNEGLAKARQTIE